MPDNPSIRECWKCGEATAEPWPAPSLCQTHLEEDRAKEDSRENHT